MLLRQSRDVLLLFKSMFPKARYKRGSFTGSGSLQQDRIHSQSRHFVADMPDLLGETVHLIGVDPYGAHTYYPPFALG